MPTRPARDWPNALLHEEVLRAGQHVLPHAASFVGRDLDLREQSRSMLRLVDDEFRAV